MIRIPTPQLGAPHVADEGFGLEVCGSTLGRQRQSLALGQPVKAEHAGRRFGARLRLDQEFHDARAHKLVDQHMLMFEEGDRDE
jgi:hypothetical protein